MVNILIYILILFIILYFVFFLIVPIIKDYLNEIRTNWEINNFRDYRLKKLNKLPLIYNSLSTVIGICAFTIAIFAYINSEKQIKLSEMEYYMKINPLVRINSVEKDFNIIGYTIYNEGDVDLEDIKIKQSFRTFYLNNNTFGGVNLSQDSYVLKSKLLKTSDSLFIPFDLNENRINTFRNFINSKNEYGHDENDKKIGVLIHKINYKKEGTKSYYTNKKIVICNDVNLNGVNTFLMQSEDGFSTSDEIKMLINKIDALDNLLK